MSQGTCDFCKIIDRDDPDVREVYRDANVVAFLPAEPAVLGHVLVVPRRHVRDIWDLDADEASQLSRAVLMLADAIRDAVRPDGLNVIQSNGKAATQTVPHLHVHLVPRWSDDAMGSIWPAETNYPEKKKERVMVELRRAVRRQQKSSEPPVSPEDRRKHLDYIQAVVTRQSASSASAKSWILSVTVALFGFALAQHAWGLAVLGMLAVALFAYLDANYLRSEKQFRLLYDTVARSTQQVPLFSLDPTAALVSPGPGAPEPSAWVKFRRRYIPERSVWCSWSIAPFYTALMVAGIGVLVVSLL